MTTKVEENGGDWRLRAAMVVGVKGMRVWRWRCAAEMGGDGVGEGLVTAVKAEGIGVEIEVYSWWG